jgi:hypothetical protein
VKTARKQVKFIRKCSICASLVTTQMSTRYSNSSHVTATVTHRRCLWACEVSSLEGHGVRSWNMGGEGMGSTRPLQAFRRFPSKKSIIVFDSDRGATRGWYVSVHVTIEGRDSAVGIATGYGLDDGGVGVRVPVGSRIFPSPRRPYRLWGPPILLSNGYRGFIPRGKAVGAWSWPLTSN